jgi:hypothetical protein
MFKKIGLTLVLTLLLGLLSIASAQVMMNEVLYDTQGTDDPNIMFTEIWSASGTSIEGWTLVGINGNGGTEYLTVTLHGNIPASGYFVIGGAGVPNVTQVATIDWQNAGSASGDDCDGIDLRDSDGATVDHLCYGPCAAGHVCTGEGGANAPDPFPAAGINKSVARIPDHTDTDHNNVDWVVSDTPTPGAANSGLPCDTTFATLANIRQNNGSGVPTLLGQFVQVRGIVNVDNYVLDSLTSSNFYFQDDEAGCNVYRGTVPANIVAGDCVTVSGWVGQYNGLTEILGSGSGNCLFSAARTAHIAPPTPYQINGNTLFETYEGMLVRMDSVTIIDGTWPSQGGYANLTITDGHGQIILRIVRWTNIGGTPQPSGAFGVIGILTQYDTDSPYTSGYQITPRTANDILRYQAANDPQSVVAVRDFQLTEPYPNPFNSTAQIAFQVGSARELSLKIYDLLGREVASEVFTGLTPGAHSYLWNPTGATGLYLVRLESASSVQTAKLLYLR